MIDQAENSIHIVTRDTAVSARSKRLPIIRGMVFMVGIGCQVTVSIRSIKPGMADELNMTLEMNERHLISLAPSVSLFLSLSLTNYFI